MPYGILPPYDAIYRIINIWDIRELRSYSNLWSDVVGGISCMVGNVWLNSVYMDLATLVRCYVSTSIFCYSVYNRMGNVWCN